MTPAERYADRKARRECVDCAAKLTPDDGARCVGCAERKLSAMTRLRHERMVAAECVRCRAPVADGKELCATHDAENSERRISLYLRVRYGQ